MVRSGKGLPYKLEELSLDTPASPCDPHSKEADAVESWGLQAS